MANEMVIKRDLLKAFLLGVLQAHDPTYKVEDRLRKQTFQQSSRDDRIRIMGENYAYGEVLYRPSMTPQGQRSAKSTTRNKPHDFDVFLWYKFEDTDTYENSSQKVWDDIVEADNGVIKELENKPYLQDAGGNQYILSKPEQIRAHEVLMDSSTLELGHHMNFRITVKG